MDANVLGAGSNGGLSVHCGTAASVCTNNSTGCKATQRRLFSHPKENMWHRSGRCERCEPRQTEALAKPRCADGGSGCATHTKLQRTEDQREPETQDGWM